MAWNHKGVDIDATPAGQFRAMLNGVHIIKGSLAAVKKDIDKRLEAKAKEVVLSLPVVILQKSSRYSSEDKRQITSTVITGINPETLAVIGIEPSPSSGWQNDEILPASKANEKLLNDYVQSEAEFNRLKNLVDARSIGVHFGSWNSRVKMQYHEAVTKLQQNYDKAKKGESDE